MIPLKDDNPTEHFPYVTLALIALNVAVFIYQLSLGARGNQMMVLKMGIIPYEFTHALDIPPYSTHPLVLNLIAAMFMHGGFLHLGGNMLYLWIFGNNIEDAMGPVRFILFYLLTGVLASATHIFLQPDMRMPMIGASGAISGVLGAYLILFPKAKVLTLIILFFFITVIRIPALIILGFWFVLQFLNIYSRNNVAWFAHVGGFVSGILLVRFFVRKGFRSRFSFRR
ncbi:MAG: rhomboid family intramembrane serine protease [Nitrospiraceae bacterium]|nr:rhomboid family intramembrane serine protease [Nitrospiraceae bacterium]